MKQNKLLFLSVAAFLVVGLLIVSVWKGRQDATELNAGKAQIPVQGSALPEVHDDLLQVLTDYRKIIVLFADEKKLSATDKDAANQVGQALFHEKLSHHRHHFAQGKSRQLSASATPPFCKKPGGTATPDDSDTHGASLAHRPRVSLNHGADGTPNLA